MKQKAREKGAPLYVPEPFGVVLRLRPVIELSPDQLLELSSLNRDLRLEMTANGELIVMSPTGGESSEQNLGLAAQLWIWTRQDGTGRAFESSGGFTLPNGAIRSPDASWVANSHLEALSAEQRKKYLPLCPDFVIELISPSDRLSVTQEKMQEYLENGARLGLLLDPDPKHVYVYRPNSSKTRKPSPPTPSYPASSWTCARSGSLLPLPGNEHHLPGVPSPGLRLQSRRSSL